MNWNLPEPHWNCPAGEKIKQLVEKIPTGKRAEFTIFGSAALQIGATAPLLSNDVDLAGTFHKSSSNNLDSKELYMIAEKGSLGHGKSNPYLQIFDHRMFKTQPLWQERCRSVQMGEAQIKIPHPMDILIAKLHRLSEKDVEAFKIIREIYGKPTEEELRLELQNCVDFFKPDIQTESLHDIPLTKNSEFRKNTEKLWEKLFNRKIDITKEILLPAKKEEDHRKREGERELKDLEKTTRVIQQEKERILKFHTFLRNETPTDPASWLGDEKPPLFIMDQNRKAQINPLWKTWIQENFKEITDGLPNNDKVKNFKKEFGETERII